MKQTKKILEQQNEDLRRELLYQRAAAGKARREDQQRTDEALRQIRQAMDTVLLLVCRRYGIKKDNVLTLTLDTEGMEDAAGYTITAERREDGAYLIRAERAAGAAEQGQTETSASATT